jgi:hypothetical protein
MKSDIEMIGTIKAAAIRSIGDELAFVFPQLLDVIKECSINDIAVLGVDVHNARGEQYQTVYLSAYEVPVPRPDLAIKDWENFVQSNNSLAENFVRQHPMTTSICSPLPHRGSSV